jgi:hypothetical protein
MTRCPSGGFTNEPHHRIDASEGQTAIGQGDFWGQGAAMGRAIEVTNRITIDWG